MKKFIIALILIICTCSLGGTVITTGKTAPFPYACGAQWTLIDAAFVADRASIADANTSITDVNSLVATNTSSISDVNSLVSTNTSSIATLNAGTYSSWYQIARTIDITVGDPCDADCDFQFTSAANTSEQGLDLGAVVPKFARVLDVSIICIEDVNSTAGECAFTTDAGTASGGAQWIATAVDINDVNDCVGSGTGVGSIGAISGSTQKVYMNATPDQNWDTIDAGKWQVFVTYIDLVAIKD